MALAGMAAPVALVVAVGTLAVGVDHADMLVAGTDRADALAVGTDRADMLGAGADRAASMAVAKMLPRVAYNADLYRHICHLHRDVWHNCYNIAFWNLQYMINVCRIIV